MFNRRILEIYSKLIEERRISSKELKEIQEKYEISSSTRKRDIACIREESRFVNRKKRDRKSVV